MPLKPERFAEVYTADLDPAHAAVTAASQRPIESSHGRTPHVARSHSPALSRT